MNMQERIEQERAVRFKRELSKANAEKMSQILKAHELMATSAFEVPR
jgi:hypothetical protein